MAYNLIENTDKHMTRNRVSLPRPLTFYPSEASVAWTDQYGIPRISGQCLRQVWYRLTSKPGSIKPDAYAEWIFALGKAVEQILVEEWKQMGIWVDNNIKFYDINTNISGEIDVFLSEPDGTLYAVECCSPDSLVLTENYVLLPFHSFNSSKVISHQGSIENIKNIQIKEVKNKILYRFHSKFDGLLAEFTEEHPILTANVRCSRYKKNNKKRTRHFESTEFKKASEVQVGDYFCIPKAKFGFAKTQEFYHNIAYSSYHVLTDKSDWKFLEKDGKIYSLKNNHGYKPIPSKINNLAEFYWILGLYIAEGSCGTDAVYFSLNINETNIIDRLCKSMKDIFGLESTISQMKNSKTKELTQCVNVRFCSKPFRELIKSLVPGSSVKKTKRVNYDRICGNPVLLEQILLGAWQGDGCFASTNEDSQYRISTVVPHLAYLYFQIAAQLELSPRLKKYKQQSNLNADYIYCVEWSSDKYRNKAESLIDCGDFWAYKIKKIKTRNYTGPVYNLECLPKHTYTVGGIATHNCKSFAGYQAKKEIIGNKSQAGAPKTNQMLQALIYTDLGRRLGTFPYTKMVYYARDMADRTEFDIALTDDNGHFRPTVNGKVDYRFTMQDIYDRYALLKSYWESKQLPPRDYEDAYDIDKVHLYQSVGEISKTAFEEWKKNPTKNPIGDWQCRYCSMHKVCKSEQ